MPLEPYDPTKAQDNTGRAFDHRLRAQDRVGPDGNLKIFRNPKLLECEKCGGERWYVLADDHPQSALIQLFCPKCKSQTRPMELRVPQMDDERAKKLGLYVPKLTIETEIDVRGDWH